MTRPKTTKLARVKERLFQNVPTIDTKEGVFVPLPMLLRFVLHKFKSREWQVLSWIYLNCRKESLCSFSLDEIGSALAYKSKPKMREMLTKLEKQFWIMRREEQGRDYYLLRDPRDAIRLNAEAGNVTQKELDAINEFLELMGRDPIAAEVKKKGKP